MSTTLPLPSKAASTFKPAPRLTLHNTNTLAQAHAHALIFGGTKVGKTTTAVSICDPKDVVIVTTQPEEQLAHLKKLKIGRAHV